MIAFRADASLQIGSGHVMRCLALADALRKQSAECHFICREHAGHLNDLIRERGFVVTTLPSGATDFRLTADGDEPLLAHATWLGCDWQIDAEQTHDVIERLQPDWLVVDHYALDARWQAALKPHYRKLMVIDDLADRPHLCNLLLDQNLGRQASDYIRLVPDGCTMLIGPKCALLRPEFAALRERSLKRRENPRLKNLLITMGGTDKENATGLVLEALKHSNLPADCRITVVMGDPAPSLARVRQQATTLNWPTEVRVNVTDMAQLMTDSDLAIGAAGSTSWERCCLGLPTLVVVLAKNQRSVGTALDAAGAARLLGDIHTIAKTVSPALAQIIEGNKLHQMSRAAQHICDGRGVEQVVRNLRPDSDNADLTECLIRPMVEEDMEMVLQWRSHPEVRRYMFSQHEISPAEHRAWFEQSSQDGTRHLLIVEEADTSLGFANFTETGPGGVADWGFYTIPAAPKGTGRKLGRVALNYAFGHLGFHKICGQVLAFNEHSIAFHQMLGFKAEGVLRDQHFDGEHYHAVHCFGLLAEEWHQQR